MDSPNICDNRANSKCNPIPEKKRPNPIVHPISLKIFGFNLSLDLRIMMAIGVRTEKTPMHPYNIYSA
jgi:hypothetical protein